jgi:hypothetical protein
LQEGDGSVRAEVFVPVWTSQLLVNDWWQPAPAPLKVTVVPQGQQWQVKVENRTERNLSNALVVIEDHVIPLGEIPSRQSKTFIVSTGQGVPLATFVLQHGAGFEEKVQQRQRTFGGRGSGRLDDLPNGSMAASFLSRLRSPQQPGYQQPAYQYSQRQFIAPPGLDLSAVAGRGNAVLLAWAADYAPVKTMRQFTPRRSHQNTLWRVTVPVQSPKSKVQSLGSRIPGQEPNA